MQHLRPYLRKLLAQGRLLLLCDGLDEVDAHYRADVSAELAELLLMTQNRFVITCRETDYLEQQDVMKLVDEGHMKRALMRSLRLEQVREFIEQYIEDQPPGWQHTAGQIMQLIEYSRLRYLCTNPFMLFILLEIIDNIGIERGKELDTRGLLLQEYAVQLFERAQKQPTWKKEAPAESEIVYVLSNIACAAHWSGDPYALHISVSVHGGQPDETVAEGLVAWLNECAPKGLLEGTPSQFTYDLTALANILGFAQDAGLIELSSQGILSFRHALFADYWAAEYFLNNATTEQTSSPSLASDFLARVEYWSNIIALWAGLVDNPIQLAEWFIKMGRVHGKSGTSSTGKLPVPIDISSRSFLQMVMLSLICMGVTWTPPQADVQRESVLPTSLVTVLTNVMSNQTSRDQLADLFTRCAEEGVQEMYYALIPLLMVEGIEEFLVLLDMTVVLQLLFTYLCDTVDLPAFEAQVKRLCRILWQFGEEAVPYAAQLSQPAPNRSLRLQTASINILGGTQASSAVEPLIACLSDQEQYIVDRTVKSLLRLGPELSLLSILQGLENRSPGAATRQTHEAILSILAYYLEEKDPQKQLSVTQYQHILESIIFVLGSSYTFEAEIQQQAQQLLIYVASEPISSSSVAHTSSTREASVVTTTEAIDPMAQMVVNLLIKYLSSADEMLVHNVTDVLQEIGKNATPYMLEYLRQNAPEIVRMRLVEIVKNIHDTRSLPGLLRLVADPSLLVQQQVVAALRSYSPASIPGLIDLLLSDPNELVAERAAYILGEIGEPVVMPVAQVMLRIVPGRTRLLVQIAERLHDERMLPMLVTLARTGQADPLLTIAVVRALSQFATKEVVEPILEVLANPQPQIYEEAIDALSALGYTSLEGLIHALDVREETPVTARVRRALLGMEPFPGEDLVRAIPQASDAQVRQIMTVLRMQGTEAAHVLVQHLFDEDQRVQGYVWQTLIDMPGAIVVPALLEVINRPTWREGVAELLLRYPEAISPLVSLLSEPERADAALAILPRFGHAILTPLITALADSRLIVQEYAQRIIVTLVQQKPTAITQVVHLFSSALPLRAHESLMEVLTNDLVTVSIPALLDGLEDAHLIEHVSDALVRLAKRPNWQGRVLDELLTSLRKEELRRGAEITLIKAGALAVHYVGELITDQNQAVAQAACDVLREIGAPALPFIWAAHGDINNRARRDAAMRVFHSMPTDAIKNALVEMLSGEKSEDIAMAQALLLERIYDEAALPLASHEMIPSLLEYVQIHDREVTSLRIIALLLLLGGEAVVKHLVTVLYDYPEHHEQLTHIFLFLGEGAPAALQRIVNDMHAPARLRGEAVSVLGLLGPFKEVYEHAQTLSSYGLVNNRTGILNPEQLSVSLRALGSLLASGDWDIPTLQNLRRISQDGSPQHELYQILLGWRYTPEIIRVQNELQNEREDRKNEIMNLTARIVQDREQIHELEEQLEQAHHEHGLRSDELLQVNQEREAMRNNLDQVVQEREAYRGRLDKALQEREVFRTSLEQALQMQQNLQAEVTQLQSYNALLQQQLNHLRGSP
ncbi:MAG: HEAT repeat domain-containing protein [Ktedonobacteraceae bacterium]